MPSKPLRAHGLTMVVTLEVLLAGLGSGVSDVDVAVLVILVPPGAVTVTTIVIVAELEAGMSPTSTRTVPFVPGAGTGPQAPSVVKHEVNVVPGGRGSLTSTLLAVLGPLLATVIV
jgi:hypothetical protein